MKACGSLVSIIVPVFNVQGQVRKCLKSIVAQSYREIEIIIVDDCSSDNSGTICQEVIAENEGVAFKYIKHDQNKGLGAARNTGIDCASGEYILFVDSDDWIEVDLLQRAMNNAQHHGSDVVIFNHKRAWPSGYTRMNWRTDLFDRLANKKLTDGDRVEIFKNLNVAWNKLYSMAFIKREEIRFGEGYYEDIPWTYYILSVDANITLENYAGYYYYQRPGSILNSSTEKHFEIFDRYSELFARQKQYASHLLNEECKRECFFRFVEHVVNMSFERADRIPEKLRDKFALRAGSEIRKHALALDYNLEDFNFSSDPRLRWRYPVLMMGNRTALSIFKNVRPLVRKAFSVKTHVTSWVRKQESRLKKIVYPKLYEHVFLKLPIKSEIAIFSAYWDSQIACNPKAISDELENVRPDIQKYWIIKNGIRVKPGYHIVRPYSLKYYYLMAVGKYFINNANFPNFVVKRVGQVHIQTKHGTPMKKMGYDLIRESRANDLSPKWFAHRCARWDYVISSNVYSSELWRGAFPFDYKLLEIGYPRNDLLCKLDDNKILDIKAKLGLPKNKLVILYSPTFRDYDKSHVPEFDPYRFIAEIGVDAVILVRSHYFRKGREGLVSDGVRVVDVNEWPSIEELYAVSDIMISDYSSSIFDYLNLKRPVFLYAYDYEKYQDYRGIYIDLEKEFDELFVRTEFELVEKVKSWLNGSRDFADKIERLSHKFTSLDDGKASQRLIESVFES
ncbi:bifunctional glycosyltransferase/CDP-glycerol:glycerophosphate glycerophosphotransferase [Microbulbifer sp. SA54]|uniref:bifunctional glycosyltransferase/CDP-glycerol:glycerophosphate glycerophosphotransferase n=1 Tax=Microbulbifer sp. SA54 TaxID=3401577 RepID=UPI003AAE7336